MYITNAQRVTDSLVFARNNHMVLLGAINNFQIN